MSQWDMFDIRSIRRGCHDLPIVAAIEPSGSGEMDDEKKGDETNEIKIDIGIVFYGNDYFVGKCGRLLRPYGYN